MPISRPSSRGASPALPSSARCRHSSRTSPGTPRSTRQRQPEKRRLKGCTDDQPPGGELAGQAITEAQAWCVEAPQLDARTRGEGDAELRLHGRLVATRQWYGGRIHDEVEH